MTPNTTDAPVDLPLLPVRMLNEFTYCPRLGYLEWVQGEFADSADTVEGRYRHRRVDQGSKRPAKKEPDGEEEKIVIHAQSVSLSSERLGLTAKIDLVEGEGARVTPVDYKKSKRPHVAKGAWEPELVQLCAQGLLLQEQGYECTEGVIYFVGSRERVTIPFDGELIALTLERIAQMRRAVTAGQIPPPLEESPKCVRCSLVGICLPDEVRFLTMNGNGLPEPRPLFPASDDTLPLHIQHPGAKVAKRGDVLAILDGDALLTEARLGEISQVSLFGGIHISTPVVQELCRRAIPITYLSSGGWFYGITHGMNHKNIDLRRHQFRAAEDRARCLQLARRFVAAKVANCRTLLRRNHELPIEQALQQMKWDIEQAGKTESLDQLLGVEGLAARRYFEYFDGMLKLADPLFPEFDFNGRNRRPPRDPINALLSLAYAMLAREWTVVIQSVGLDPYLGFYHQPRYGRPALALDLMEEFRPIIADSAVITAINNGEVTIKDFIKELGAVSLTPEGRSRFIQTYERRMSSEIAHPVFGYRISYRRVFEVQARLLGRYLTGEIPEYPAFVTR